MQVLQAVVVKSVCVLKPVFDSWKLVDCRYSCAVNYT